MSNRCHKIVRMDPQLTPIAAAVAATLLGAPAAFSQESASGIEEIFVTATRRESSVQSIPYNISAIGGDELDRRGITDFNLLAKAIPGVTFNDPTPRAGLVNALVIRGLDNTGVGLNNVPATQQNPISTYVNETPIFVNLRLKDIERVEVLRGPQGTLYGAGSLGGALRFIARRPDLNAFSGTVSAGVGQTADSDDLNYESDAILNVPFSDTFGGRLHVGYEDRAGYIDAIGLYQLDSNGDPVMANPADPINSVALYQPRKKDVNNNLTKSARLSLRWQPSDTFDANFSYHYQTQESGGRDVIAFQLAGEDGREQANVIDEPFESEVKLASLELEADLGFATLTSSTSSYDTTAEGSTDYLNLYLDLGIYESIYGASPRPLHRQDGANNNDAFVQELRLVSNGERAIDWIAGAFYLDQDIDLINAQFFPGYQEYFDACVPVHGIWFTTGETVCGLGTITGIRNGILVTDESTYQSNVFTNYTDLAVYGEITWHVTDSFQVTGGLRAFRQDYTTTQQAGLLWTPDEPGNRTASGEASDVLFKVNASYNFSSDLMVYSTVSEGFRRGGVNGLPETIAGVPTNPDLFEYEPDKVLNLEIGLKGTVANRFQYTLSYFNVDWENMQVDAAATQLILQSVDNIGDASSKGAEFELTSSVTDNLSISGGYTYLTTKIDSSNPPDGLVGIPPAGEPLPSAPETLANVHFNYYQPMSNGWAIDYRLTGAYRSQLPKVGGGAGFDPDKRGEALTTWDLSITLYSGSSWSIRGYAINVLDETANLRYIREDYVQSNSDPLFGIPVSPPSPRLTPFNEIAWARTTPPRTMGLLVTYEFGG